MKGWETQNSVANQKINASHYQCLGFPGSSVGKESACSAGDPGSIPGSGRSSGEEIGYPLQYSWASLVAQLVKNPAAMQIKPGFNPWVGEIPWRRAWQPTPVFWPGESHGLYTLWRRRVGHDWVTFTFTFIISIWQEGKLNHKSL